MFLPVISSLLHSCNIITPLDSLYTRHGGNALCCFPVYNLHPHKPNHLYSSVTGTIYLSTRVTGIVTANYSHLKSSSTAETQLQWDVKETSLMCWKSESSQTHTWTANVRNWNTLHYRIIISSFSLMKVNIESGKHNSVWCLFTRHFLLPFLPPKRGGLVRYENLQRTFWLLATCWISQYHLFITSKHMRESQNRGTTPYHRSLSIITPPPASCPRLSSVSWSMLHPTSSPWDSETWRCHSVQIHSPRLRPRKSTSRLFCHKTDECWV